MDLFAAAVTMDVPDWLTNVDFWSVVIGAVVALLGTKYPTVVAALKAILARLAPGSPGGKPTPAAEPVPGHPVLNELLVALLGILMTKHATNDPAVAVAREVALSRVATPPPAPPPPAPGPRS